MRLDVMDAMATGSSAEIAPRIVCNVAADGPIHNLVLVLNIRPEACFVARIGTQARCIYITVSSISIVDEIERKDNVNDAPSPKTNNTRSRYLFVFL